PPLDKSVGLNNSAAASAPSGHIMLHRSIAAILAVSSATACVQVSEAAAPVNVDGGEMEVVYVVGSGQTRQVQSLLPENLDVLPPGASVQKALNIMPGVNAQSVDALGANEQSLSMSVRGFNTT